MHDRGAKRLLRVNGALNQSGIIDACPGATFAQWWLHQHGEIRGSGHRRDRWHTGQPGERCARGGAGASGILTISGNLDTSAGTGGSRTRRHAPGTQFDRVEVMGNVQLGRNIVCRVHQRLRASGESFDVIRASGSLTGTFTTRTLPAGMRDAIVAARPMPFGLVDVGSCTGICWDDGGGDGLWIMLSLDRRRAAGDRRHRTFRPRCGANIVLSGGAKRAGAQFGRQQSSDHRRRFRWRSTMGRGIDTLGNLTVSGGTLAAGRHAQRRQPFALQWRRERCGTVNVTNGYAAERRRAVAGQERWR